MTAAAEMTDCEFLLHVLDDGQPHTLNEILRRSFNERGCGMTVHSRAADLRKQGHMVLNATVAGAARGDASTYQLIAPEERRPLAVVDGSPVAVAEEQLDLFSA